MDLKYVRVMRGIASYEQTYERGAPGAERSEWG